MDDGKLPLQLALLFRTQRDISVTGKLKKSSCADM
jgi:hypothetical protein